MREILKSVWKRKLSNLLKMLQIILVIVYFFVTAASIQQAFMIYWEVPKVLDNNMEKIIHLEVQDETNLADFQNFCNSLKNNQLINEIAHYESSFFESEKLDNKTIGNLKVDYKINQIKNFQVREGRNFSERDLQNEISSLLIGSELARKFNLKIGDMIKDFGSDNEYRIIGILKENSHWFQQSISEGFILSLDQQVITLLSSEDEDYVRLHYYCTVDSKNIKSTIDKIETVAEDNHIFIQAKTVADELNEQFNTILNNNIYWLIFSIIIMFIISIGTASLTITHLYARKKEIGIRLAVGYSPNQIIYLFAGEILVFTLLAYGMACLLGYIMIGNGMMSLGGSESYTGFVFTGKVALFGGVAALVMCLPSMIALLVCVRKFQPKNLIGGKE